MNSNTRLMIRLIDVALIVLLGFINISRLKTDYVDLSSAMSDESVKYMFHDARLTIFQNSFKLDDGGKSTQVQSLSDLESLLVSKNDLYKRYNEKLIITIEPHKSSIMQKLVDVFDICHRNKIEKTLNYESYN